MKENSFSNKFKSYSNAELQRVISQDSFVHKAKQAAAWELEKRNVEHNYNPPNQKEKKKLSDFEKTRFKKMDRWDIFHENRLLFFGLFCIALAFYTVFPALFTFKDSLIPIESQIRDVDVKLERVTSRGRYGFESESNKISLNFWLNGIAKRFVLTKNVGQEYRCEEFSQISKKLYNSNKVVVWVKDTDTDNRYPKVLQLDIDGKTVIAFENVKTEYGGAFVFLLILGICSTALVLWRKYPVIFDKIIVGKK